MKRHFKPATAILVNEHIYTYFLSKIFGFIRVKIHEKGPFTRIERIKRFVPRNFSHPTDLPRTPPMFPIDSEPNGRRNASELS